MHAIGEIVALRLRLGFGCVVRCLGSARARGELLGLPRRRRLQATWRAGAAALLHRLAISLVRRGTTSRAGRPPTRVTAARRAARAGPKVLAGAVEASAVVVMATATTAGGTNTVVMAISGLTAVTIMGPLLTMLDVDMVLISGITETKMIEVSILLLAISWRELRGRSTVIAEVEGEADVTRHSAETSLRGQLGWTLSHRWPWRQRQPWPRLLGQEIRLSRGPQQLCSRRRQLRR